MVLALPWCPLVLSLWPRAAMLSELSRPRIILQNEGIRKPLMMGPRASTASWR